MLYVIRMQSIVSTCKDRMETARQRIQLRQLEQSKLAEAEDDHDIITAHEVSKHLALRYVYELDNCH